MQGHVRESEIYEKPIRIVEDRYDQKNIKPLVFEYSENQEGVIKKNADFSNEQTKALGQVTPVLILTQEGSEEGA